jgi:dUTP pyrophosphatase
LRISNTPGTIDSGYRDELGIIMTNSSESCGKKEEKMLSISAEGNKKGTYKIRKGDRIAQLVLQVVPKMKLTLVDSVQGVGTNRGGGFGSTGVKQSER